MNSTPRTIDDVVLGHCLNSYGAIHQVAVIIHKPEVFVTQDNQRVYAVMLNLIKQNHQTDLITVTNELIGQYGLTSSLSLPWVAYVATLAASGKFFAGNLEYLCYELVKNAVEKTMQQEAGRMLRDLADPTVDPIEVLDQALTRLQDIRNRIFELKEQPFPESYKVVIKRAELAAQIGNPITGLSTLLYKVDSYAKGLQNKTLTIIAARPSMGKTALLCQATYNLAHLQKIPVAVFSLEMSKDQLAGRYLSIDANIKNGEVISGLDRFGSPINISRLWESAGELSGSPLYVYDTIFSIDMLEAKSRQLKREKGVKVIFIDYIGLIEMDGNLSTSDRIGRVSRRLKKLSGTLDMPVIALAQLNRDVENEADRRPKLKHLNHSGSIEQDADNVIFMLRPGYYFTKDEDGNEIDPKLLKLIFAKNRNGSTHNDSEAIELNYDQSTNRIWEYQSHYPVVRPYELTEARADVF